MTASAFHRAPIVTGSLFRFQPDTGEAWQEPTLFDAATDDAPAVLTAPGVFSNGEVIL